MKKNIWVITLLALIAILALSACQLSASKAPAATPTGNLPFPTPIPDNALKNIQSQTQTAQAAVGKATPVTSQKTPAAPTVEPKSPAEPTQTQAAPVQPVEPVATAVPPTATKIPVVVPTATPGRPATYVVQVGEFPFCLARRFNVNPSDLLALNGLSKTSSVLVGAELKIPQSGSWSAGDRSLIAHPATYTVKAGDNVFSIACAYGDADPNAIIAANGLTSGFALTAGQSLQIP